MPSGRVGRANPDLGPLLRGPGERAGYWMALRMLARDGQLKVRVLLPLNTPLAVLVLGIATSQFEPPALAGSAVLPLVAVYGVALCLAPVLWQLRITDSPEAAWLLQTAPLARPVDLLLGAAKAVWLVVVAPIALGLSAVLLWQWGDALSAMLHGLMAWALAWPFALGALYLFPTGRSRAARRDMIPFSATEARGGSIGPLALPMAMLSTLAGMVGVAHAASGGHPALLVGVVVATVPASWMLRRGLA